MICRLVPFLALFVIAPVRPAVSQVDVYFNNSADSSLALHDSYAHSDADFLELVSAEILGADSSIDVAMYNLTQDAVTDALITAHNRGVRVRVIGHVSNVLDGESFEELKGAGIPVWHNPEADSGERQALMHHKFLVIDNGTSTGPPTVITGSWNATYWQTVSDPNNVVVVRDSAVASFYTEEFEEMWGAPGDIPDSLNARFGENKVSGTGRTFQLSDGNRVRIWFSPSDLTSSGIDSLLATGESSIYVSAFSFTYDGLAQRLEERVDVAGTDVRVLIDNVDDIGSEYEFLSGFADVHEWDSPKQLHHKYAIIDAIPIDGDTDPIAVTGSHNWSYSAERYNDENVIAIFDDTIANHYLQEFAARYTEAGGQLPFGVDADVPNRLMAQSEARIWPNPARTTITISGWSSTQVVVTDVLGRALDVSTKTRPGGIRIDVSRHPSGSYLVTLGSGPRRIVVPLRIVR